MLSFEDDRWESLAAGYRIPVDLRPLLLRLEQTEEQSEIWPEVWEELYHQGDVGEGSYVAVPHLLRIHRAGGVADWNVYALAATIELARGTPRNPRVPEWAKEAYEQAVRELAILGLEELAGGDPGRNTPDPSYHSWP